MITIAAIASAEGTLTRVLRTIAAQAFGATANGTAAYIDRADTVYATPSSAIAQGSFAAVRRTDMPAAPKVLVAFDLGISAVNSTQRIEAA